MVLGSPGQKEMYSSRLFDAFCWVLLRIKKNPSLAAVLILEKTRRRSRTGKKQEVCCLPRVTFIQVPLCPAVARALSPCGDRGWWPEELGGTEKSHPGLPARLLLAHRRGCRFDVQTEANLCVFYYYYFFFFFFVGWEETQREEAAGSRWQRGGERVPGSGQRGVGSFLAFSRRFMEPAGKRCFFPPPPFHPAT